ncbi:MAG: galactokinase family protein [Planctomycetota bacterium]|nr:galactokinase family protein [Planctomycetota bacterium]
MPSLSTKVELLFGGRCKRPPQGVHFAPGRLVMLGEHLDHQLGPVLAAPLSEGVACAWGVRPDSRVVVWSMNARQKDSFHQGQVFKSGRGWADLARGAYAHVGSDGRRMPGIDLMVLGDLPIGAGLASSAAYLVVILRSLYEAIGEYRSRWELAEDVPAIESEWLGVRCGNMDPYVVAAAKPGQVLHLDCRELNHDVLQLAEGFELTAEDTGIERRLADTPYNARRSELETALGAAREAAPDLRGLCDLTPEAFAAIEDQLDETSRRRARHVVMETARVAEAKDAILAGDMATLGALMNAGHASLATDFESSLPVIDAQADRIRGEAGVLGARLNGAGWGGHLAVLRRAAS